DGVRALQDIERDAAALGELELQGRAALALADRLRGGDRLARAGAAIDRAYRQAVAIHSDDLAAVTLGQRSVLAERSGNARAAHDLAKLARELAHKPTVSARTTARVYLAIERAEHARGQDRAAIEIAKQGLEAIARSGRSIRTTELALRVDIVTS